MGIAAAMELWHATRKLKVAPDDVTKASLVDHLALSRQVHIYSPTDMLEYHSLLLGADELGVLLPAHDLNFMSVMNKLYDNPARYKESRRGREEDLVIANPQATMLAGTQPDFLASLLPDEAWGMGFMSRIMMVYSGKAVRVSLFGKRLAMDKRDLIADLITVTKLQGEFSWSDEAEKKIEAWHFAGGPPKPMHTKLKHYVPRRTLHVVKLSMISCAARGNDMLVDDTDVQRAIDWLVEIEGLMPDIFKDMAGKSDGLIIQDLHHFLWDLWVSKKKLIHRSRIEMFLSARTPAYNVGNILDLCVSMQILIDRGNDLFEPGSVSDTGEE